MYRMDEYTKRQLSNQWRLNFFYFDFLEFIFYLNISNFHFLWKQKKIPGNRTKILEKNAGILYKSLRRGKLFRLTLLFS